MGNRLLLFCANLLTALNNSFFSNCVLHFDERLRIIPPGTQSAPVKEFAMDTTIASLGKVTIKSPLAEKYKNSSDAFVSDDDRIIYESDLKTILENKNSSQIISFEKAGPRKEIYFDPSKVKAAIVTCGGICPGLNDVIRSIVMESYYGYGIKNIFGIQYGYTGLLPDKGYELVQLFPKMVDTIHTSGGTVLGSSRGGTDDMEAIVDSLERLNINILYTIGGDGTLRASQRIADIVTKRNLKISVIGIPKTIDNDINFVSKTFGFETAFSEASRVLTLAHVESKGAPNGIGLVKVMGRHSGYIAANAALATNVVNFVLIPEVPFDLDGPNGFLHHLEERINKSGHAVICVAEGAGQNMLYKEEEKIEKDASGNLRLADIGVFLRDKINDHFRNRGIEANTKYIDPSYIVRSIPANPNDSFFCAQLGQYAVHAAMAGKTNMLVGSWRYDFTHLPISLATSKRKQVNPNSRYWYSVLQATGQPPVMKN